MSDIVNRWSWGDDGVALIGRAQLEAALAPLLEDIARGKFWEDEHDVEFKKRVLLLEENARLRSLDVAMLDGQLNAAEARVKELEEKLADAIQQIADMGDR